MKRNNEKGMSMHKMALSNHLCHWFFMNNANCFLWSWAFKQQKHHTLHNLLFSYFYIPNKKVRFIYTPILFEIEILGIYFLWSYINYIMCNACLLSILPFHLPLRLRQKCIPLKDLWTLRPYRPLFAMLSFFLLGNWNRLKCASKMSKYKFDICLLFIDLNFEEIFWNG